MEVSHDVGVLSLRSCSPQDTEAIGAALAPVLRAGDVVLLVGELGSGKTALTRGQVRALGSADPVTSPILLAGVTRRPLAPVHGRSPDGALIEIPFGMPPNPERTLNCYSFCYVMNGHGLYADAHTPWTNRFAEVPIQCAR